MWLIEIILYLLLSNHKILKYLSPLIIIGLIIIFFGIYGLFSYSEGTSTGVPDFLPFLYLVAIGIGIFCLLVHLVISYFFKKIGTIFLVQIVIILVVISTRFITSYKSSPELVFIFTSTTPEIAMIVYGVEGQKKTKMNLFSNKVEINMPTDGVFLTSSPHELYVSESMKNSETGNTKKIQDLWNTVCTDYYVPLEDTISFGGKSYHYRTWKLNSETDWEVLKSTCPRMKNTAREKIAEAAIK